MADTMATPYLCSSEPQGAEGVSDISQHSQHSRCQPRGRSQSESSPRFSQPHHRSRTQSPFRLSLADDVSDSGVSLEKSNDTHAISADFDEVVDSCSTAATAADLSARPDLLRLVSEGNYDEVASAIASDADVNQRGKDDRTPLILASQLGQAQIVELLLEKGADFRARTQGGSTAFMCAMTGKGQAFRQIESALREAAGEDSVLALF
mmetsp:Transcript_26512/g.43500  ORF Transcript_26512/g.43500 Transcript_26512/m.43500 type:complete len:208 (-) Transcript_26512:176-799(-)